MITSVMLEPQGILADNMGASAICFVITPEHLPLMSAEDNASGNKTCPLKSENGPEWALRSSLLCSGTVIPMNGIVESALRGRTPFRLRECFQRCRDPSTAVVLCASRKEQSLLRMTAGWGAR